MAVSQVVQVRVPSEVQSIARQVIQEAGLSVSDVVRVLMTRIAKDGAIPETLFQPNAKTIAACQELQKGMGAGQMTLEEMEALNHAPD